MKTVIMCGGAGTRLWPLSTEDSPKQFLQIFNGESLYEKTIHRNINYTDEFIIVVNEKQFNICEKQSKRFHKKFTFIVEPTARNTAPAILLASFSCNPEDNLLVVPSDHLIYDEDAYKKSLDFALIAANNKQLVTFGIRPQYPETGFGYIEISPDLNDAYSKVLSFKEKPSLDKATEFLEKGNFLWNSGIFCFKAINFINEVCTHAPEIYQKTKKVFINKTVEDDCIRLPNGLMEDIPSESIDYAVIEKSQNVSVVPSNFRWSDLGSYDSLYNQLERDSNGNTRDVKLAQVNSHNNLVISNKKKIALFNVDDLIIIDSPNAVLVGKRGSSKDIKFIKKES